MKHEQFPKQYVRVLDSTYSENKEAKEMIGGDFEVKNIYYSENIIVLYNKDKSNYWWFNFSDVKLLTPVEYNGKKIGIGDKVNVRGCWYEVILFFLDQEKYKLGLIHENGWFVYATIEEIQDIDPLYKPKETEVENAIKVLTEAGKIKDGKILV